MSRKRSRSPGQHGAKPAHIAKMERQAMAKNWAEHWASKPTPEQVGMVMAALRSSLDTVVRGSHPGPDEWKDIADVCNVVDTMVRVGMANPDETQPLVDESNRSMGEAAKRYRATGSMRLSGAGLQAIRDLFAIYEAMLGMVTRAEFKALRERTDAEVRKDIEQAHLDGSREVVTL